jgi:hypothetical protein
MKSMTVYMTTEDKEVLKKNFLKLRFFGLISVPDIIESIGETYENMSLHSQFIVNKTITQEMETVLKKNRFYAVIYSNPWMDKETIMNMHNYLQDHPHVKKIVLLDFKENPQNEEMFELFEEVAFFPSVKKIKIFECEVQKSPMLYWVNDMKIPE